MIIDTVSGRAIQFSLLSLPAKVWQIIGHIGQVQDVAPSVATEVALVTNRRRSCDTGPLVRGMPAVCRWW